MLQIDVVAGVVLNGLEVLEVGDGKGKDIIYKVKCLGCSRVQDMTYSGVYNRKNGVYKNTCTFCWRGARPPVVIGEEEARQKKQAQWKTARGKIRQKMADDPEYAKRVSKSKNKPVTDETWAMYRLRSLKSRAIRNGVPWEQDAYKGLSIPEHCPVLGIPVFRGKLHLTMNSPSMDRIVPEKGYVKGNLQVISQLANGMKQNATPEQLLKFSEWIQKTYAPQHQDTNKS